MGFTRNLNINFLRTVKVGEFVIMETEVSFIFLPPWHFGADVLRSRWLLTDRSQLKQIGRTMGYMTGEMRREKDGAIISTCEQNKFNSSSGSGMVAGKL